MAGRIRRNGGIERGVQPRIPKSRRGGPGVAPVDAGSDQSNVTLTGVTITRGEDDSAWRDRERFGYSVHEVVHRLPILQLRRRGRGRRFRGESSEGEPKECATENNSNGCQFHNSVWLGSVLVSVFVPYPHQKEWRARVTGFLNLEGSCLLGSLEHFFWPANGPRRMRKSVAADALIYRSMNWMGVGIS